MSKLIDVSKLITLKNFSKKYEVSLRKIYRYINEKKIEFVDIDGVSFLYDRVYNELLTDHRVKTNVKILTKEDSNVKTLTKQTTNVKNLTKLNNSESDNYVDIVKTLTIPNTNVKISTKDIDKILTLDEKKILFESDDRFLTIRELELKDNIRKKLISYTTTT